MSDDKLNPPYELPLSVTLIMGDVLKQCCIIDKNKKLVVEVVKTDENEINRYYQQYQQFVTAVNGMR